MGGLGGGLGPERPIAPRYLSQYFFCAPLVGAIQPAFYLNWQLSIIENLTCRVNFSMFIGTASWTGGRQLPRFDLNVLATFGCRSASEKLI